MKIETINQILAIYSVVITVMLIMVGAVLSMEKSFTKLMTQVAIKATKERDYEREESHKKDEQIAVLTEKIKNKL